MNKKRWGIVLLILGIAAVLGSFVNGTFAEMSQGMEASDVVMILLIVTLVVGGIVLIIKDKKK